MKSTHIDAPLPQPFVAQADAALLVIHCAERVFACVALVALFLPGLALALAITLLSGRSPLVRHSRLGWGGSALPMLKFRTMWPSDGSAGRLCLIEDVSDTVPVVKAKNDRRVTSSLAAFCRRYSIDELPQLWHVVRGEMSLAGPRPITVDEMRCYYGRAAAEVLSVRPGMAGLWQTMGRSSLKYPQRRRLDLFFVRHLSAALYVKVVLRAIPAVLRGTEAA